MSVVHCKKESYDVYIGRPSKWGNPFSHKSGTQAKYQVATREEAIAAYKALLWQQIKDGTVTLQELAELDGKVLGCWCKPAACHGDVLAAAAAWAKKQLG
jgi:hypothetical protein